MKRVWKIAVWVLFLLVTNSFSFQKLDFREAKFKNVCKDLRGDVLLYFVFIDSKTTSPWTEFDIKTTLDSVAKARQWLLDQAKANNVVLNIKTDYYIGSDYSTVSRNLPNGTVGKSAVTPNFKKGLAELNEWADQIARKIGGSFNIIQKDGIPEVKSPRNKERLIAYLRDEYKVESVALMFFVNNYFRTDISLPVNTMTTDDVEFAIVSYKYPSEIAHNFLHLYGAADMYYSLYRRNRKSAHELERMYPFEIMHDPYAKKINELEISDYTKYLIGWQDTYDKNLEPFFIDKAKNF